MAKIKLKDCNPMDVVTCLLRYNDRNVHYGGYVLGKPNHYLVLPFQLMKGMHLGQNVFNFDSREPVFLDKETEVEFVDSLYNFVLPKPVYEGMKVPATICRKNNRGQRFDAEYWLSHATDQEIMVLKWNQWKDYNLIENGLISNPKGITAYVTTEEYCEVKVDADAAEAWIKENRAYLLDPEWWNAILRTDNMV